MMVADRRAMLAGQRLEHRAAGMMVAAKLLALGLLVPSAALALPVIAAVLAMPAGFVDRSGAGKVSHARHDRGAIRHAGNFGELDHECSRRCKLAGSVPSAIARISRSQFDVSLAAISVASCLIESSTVQCGLSSHSEHSNSAPSMHMRPSCFAFIRKSWSRCLRLMRRSLLIAGWSTSAV